LYFEVILYLKKFLNEQIKVKIDETGLKKANFI
jgi:hypothetical protein